MLSVGFVLSLALPEFITADDSPGQATTPSAQTRLNVDLAKGFILGGTSAGANFTAGIAHKARIEGLTPRLTGVVFLAGSFCHPDTRPEKYLDRILSVDEINDAPGLTRKYIDYFAGKRGPLHGSVVDFD